MTDTYTSTGKEILRNGRHFGDIIDDESAELIVKALNHNHPEFICPRCYRREDASNQGEATF